MGGNGTSMISESVSLNDPYAFMGSMLAAGAAGGVTGGVSSGVPGGLAVAPWPVHAPRRVVHFHFG